LALCFAIIYTLVFQLSIRYLPNGLLALFKYLITFIFISSLVYSVDQKVLELKDCCDIGRLNGFKTMLAFPLAFLFVFLGLNDLVILGIILTPHFAYVLFLITLKDINLFGAYKYSNKLLKNKFKDKIPILFMFSVFCLISNFLINYIIYDMIYNFELFSIGHIISNILGYFFYFFFVSAPVLLLYEFFKLEEVDLKNKDFTKRNNMMMF
jgi:hypothetical protein